MGLAVFKDALFHPVSSHKDMMPPFLPQLAILCRTHTHTYTCETLPQPSPDFSNLRMSLEPTSVPISVSSPVPHWILFQVKSLAGLAPK